MNILITAPNIYNLRLSKALTDKGFQTINLPSIETEIIYSSEIEKLIKNIHNFDFVILPSRNAIKSLFENAKSSNNNYENIFNSTNFITIGNDEKYLQTFGFSNSIKIREASTFGIYKALKILNKKIKKIAVLSPRVEIIKEPDIIPDFISNLAKIAEVKRINAYITKPNLAIKKQIKLTNFDAVLFTSGAEIEAFLYLNPRDKYLKQSKIICFGPYTGSEAIKKGLKPTYIGKNFSSFVYFAEELKQNFFKSGN